MSEAPEGGNPPSGETPAADEFKPITSQDELNRVLEDRLKRERAKYADYKDVKAKAAKLDEYEQANATEAEKAAKHIADLEAELTNTRLGATRLQIAAEFGLDEKAAAALTHVTSEEGMRDVAAAFQAKANDRKKQGNFVPREGNQPGNASENDDAIARRILLGQ